MFIHVQFVCFPNKHENKPELAKHRNASTNFTKTRNMSKCSAVLVVLCVCFFLSYYFAFNVFISFIFICEIIVIIIFIFSARHSFFLEYFVEFVAISTSRKTIERDWLTDRENKCTYAPRWMMDFINGIQKLRTCV